MPLTEPPSHMLGDGTAIEPGMVLTIEPGMDAIVGVGLTAMGDIEIIEVDQEQAGAAYDVLLVMREAARN